jgi:hypothetical protein
VMIAHHPDDGGCKHLLNAGQLPQDYTAQYPRTLSFLRLLMSILPKVFFWLCNIFEQVI